jgi:hypothetical protein
VISSLPKPVQNDLDTIIIDLLSKYNLDNKSVQKFVQTIARQVRDINRLPRILQAVKTGTGDSTKINQEVKEKSETGKNKPGFIASLENFQNSFNRGGLLGVFFDYLKNRKTEVLPRSTTPEFAKSEQKKKTDLSKPLLPTNAKETNQELPLTDTEGQQAQKQNIFRTFTVVLGGVNEQGKKDLKGLFEFVLQDFFKQQMASMSGGRTGVSAAIDESGMPGSEDGSSLLDAWLDYKMARMLLDGGGKGKKTKPKGKPAKPGARPTKPGAKPTKPGGAVKPKGPRLPGRFGGLGRLLGWLGLGAAAAGTAAQVIPSTPSPATPSIPSGPKPAPLPPGVPPIPSTPKPAPLPPGAPLIPSTPKPATAVPAKPIAQTGKGMLNKAGGLLGKLFLPIVTAVEGIQSVGTTINELSKKENEGLGWQQKLSVGTGALAGSAADVVTSFDPTTWGIDKMFGADIFGEGISKEFLNLIGAKKEDQTMGESLRERMIEGGHAVNEKAKQDILTKINKEDESKKREMGIIPLDIKAMQFGYKDLKDFGTAVSSGKEKRRMYWDNQKQSVVVVMPDKSSIVHKFVYGKGFQGKPTIEQSNQKTISDKQPSTIVEQNDPNIITPLNATPISTEKPLIPVTTKTPELITALTPDTTKSIESTTLTPETTKITSPVPQSITENSITNNNVDKKVLSDIASNTEKTNKSLTTLGDAVFKLAKVFDSKTMSNGNSVLINNNGQVQEYTSTSQIAASNVDSIRGVRQQFLAAT